MNYFSKIKVGTWIVIILTIINLTSLGTILYKTSCHKNMDKSMLKDDSHGQGGGGFWRKLDLDSLQRIKFKEMGGQFFDSMKTISKYRDKLALQIADELKKDSPDTLIMYAVCREMGNNYARQKMFSIGHILDIKNQCKPEQIEKLDSMYYFLLVGFENPRHGRHNRMPMDSMQRKQEPGKRDK
jgi:hypothetical protein